MAELRDPILKFEGGCPDCGEREAVLPIPIPGVEDDFDWRVWDYDSFRLFLMQELAHRFPERRRWTSADMEVVIVELLAAALDRAAHAQDAVQVERYLETARRPQSVRRLLKLIGYDAVERTDPADLADLPPAPPRADGRPESDGERLERYWHLNPSELKQALNGVFSSDPVGFEPGRLGFGDDVFASDIIEATMAVEGVEVACLNSFKRVGPYEDRTASGVIEIARDEFALCMNRSSEPRKGYYRLVVNGGETA